MVNLIIILVVAIIAAAIIWFLVRAKKQGQACIGCPYGKQCAKHKAGKSPCQCSSAPKDHM